MKLVSLERPEAQRSSSSIRTSSRRRAGPTALAAILASSYALLVFTWALTSPPGVAADEIAHYVRAAGVARGQWVLPGPPALPPETFSRLTRGEQRAFTQTGVVALPRSLSPHRLICFSVPFSVACPVPEPFPEHRTVLLETNMGTSPPYIHVVSGTGTLLADRVVPAMYLGRLALAVLSTALLAIAALALWQGGRAALAMSGLLAAVTPMVLSLGGSLTASGPEVVSAVCFLACLLRLSRNGEPARWVWLAAGLSGLVLAVSRELGPFFVVLQVALFLGLTGIRPAAKRVRSAPMPVAVAGTAILAGGALNAYWQLRHEPHPDLSPGALTEYYDPSWASLREIGKQAIGVFGPLDTVLNPGTYFGWIFVLIALGTLALLVAGRRDRAVLAVAIALSVVSTLALQTVQGSVGFGAQGRQLLPVFVAMPMLSGEVIHRNRNRLAHLRPRLVLWMATAVALLHAAAWYGVGRRYAMGPREEALLAPGPLWAPPAGWPFWAAVVTAAVLTIIAFGVAARSWPAGAGVPGDSPDRSGSPI